MPPPKKKLTADQVLKSVLDNTGNSRIPQMQDVSIEAVAMFGGTRALAKVLTDLFHASEAGSLQQIKILEMITRGLRSADDGKPELAEVETGDLKRILAAQLTEMEDFGDGTHHPGDAFKKAD